MRVPDGINTVHRVVVLHAYHRRRHARIARAHRRTMRGAHAAAAAAGELFFQICHFCTNLQTPSTTVEIDHYVSADTVCRDTSTEKHRENVDTSDNEFGQCT